MTEREILVAALDRADPAERAKYLDQACAGDPALRQRIEAMLRSHEQTSDFLGAPPGKQRMDLEGRTPPASSDGTISHGGAPPGGAGDQALHFLAPSQKPGSLGRLDHYEMLAVIGRGGMGVVFKAFDEKLRRVVAVKALAPHLAAGGVARRRFVREARAAAAVRHDNVIGIHAVEDAGPIPYLVMEFIDGVSLEDRLRRGGPLEVGEVVRVGLQIAAGLAAAHRQGLVHRDIKPANILLENGSGRVKITDFGLARAADDAGLTQSGHVVGTPAYMSPEQANGDPVDHRSDLFSLGSLLYTLCTGRPPFHAASTPAVLKRVCDGAPRPPREVNAEVPAWLETLISRLHAKNPGDRLQTAAEAADVLGRGLERPRSPDAIAPPPPRPGARKPGRLLLVAALGLLLAAAAGVAGYLIFRDRTVGPKPPVTSAGPAPKAPAAPEPEPEPLAPGQAPAPEDLARRRVAADVLRREDIPKEVLDQAVRDAKGDLPELVAVLGSPQPPGKNDPPGPAALLAISPDGKTLAAAGRDKVVRLWDLATGKVRLELTDHQRPDVSHLCKPAFSPDGKLLATGDRQGTIRLWDPTKGTPLGTLVEPAGELHQIAFSPDGRSLAAARDRGTTQLWDARTTKLHSTLRMGADPVYGVAFSPDGKTLAVTSGQAVCLLDVETGAPGDALWGSAPARCLAFSPDGKTLVVGGDGNDVLVRDVPGKRPPMAMGMVGHESGVCDAAWRADGGFLVTVAETDGGVRLWDPGASPLRGKEIRIAPPGAPGCCSFALSPEGRHLAVAHPNGAIYILRLAPPGQVFSLP
jgi:DNA-binding beta-propeller fold protein YncE